MSNEDVQGVAAAQLRSIVERIERLEEEKKAIADDIKDVYLEAKANGYDVKTMRAIVRLRKLESHVRQEAEALALMTRHAVGLPGADARRLQAARRVVDRVAGLDGAGPGLRLGSELLRIAHCASGADGRCAARTLPDWAAEDRLAVRLTEPLSALR